MLAVPPPEYRRCPATDRWVILAPERSLRPVALTHARPVHGHEHAAAGCPFCPGAEHLTTDPSALITTPGTIQSAPAIAPGWEQNWRVRSVPNKFPAVRVDLPLTIRHEPTGSTFYEKLSGIGRHDVIIECRDHHVSPTQIEPCDWADVWKLYHHQLHAHAEDARLLFSLVFKNVGAEAGASLAHSHSQIVGIPLIPDTIRQELDVAGEFFRRERACVYCRMLEIECASADRLVGESAEGSFVAVCPFAPRFAYEIWVLPREHQSQYELIPQDQLAELGAFTQRVFRCLETTLYQPAYNFYLHSGPLRSPNLPTYHWHLEISPRTDRQAGFEWGSGCHINPMTPEEAARQLRSAW
jgi:UDPglucose--hexose-1-phosphate uridylyltransferase